MKRMAVHSGVFHADDVFAVAFMSEIEEGLEVIRTRDPQVLETCDIVADVGGGKYDHHQADKQLREDGIPYCAFGLLWKDFGIAYLEKCFEALTDTQQKQEVVDKIAYEFITQIDASDNGVTVNTYEVPVTTISQVISSYMPFGGNEEEVNEAFFEAVAFAQRFFKKRVHKAVEMYHNYNAVAQMIAEQPVASTRLLVLDKAVGWKDAVLQLDKEAHILFVVFQDITGSYRVQAVPKEVDSFENRKDLPKAWAGARDEAMDALTGIAGCIFCHPSLFICGHKTQEGAQYLAKKAVETLEIV